MDWAAFIPAFIAGFTVYLVIKHTKKRGTPKKSKLSQKQTDELITTILPVIRSDK